MKNNRYGMPAWRKPTLCDCGARMTLALAQESWCLRCARCGATGGSKVKSLSAEREPHA